MSGKFICICGNADFFYDERYAELICRKCGRIYFILNYLKDDEV
jgi:transcription initiation factor TFIIIB Brf1 subunit/transcription initiation factor TFIIB